LAEDWVAKWWADGAEENLRLGYSLRPDSVVFDVGAYDGGWSADLIRHTGTHPRLFVVEPLEGMSQVAAQRLKGENVTIINAALSDRNGEAQIHDYSHESSMHRPGNRTIKTVDAAEVVGAFSRIDLMSINVEGHEFVIIKRLLDADLIQTIENLQVQFHAFIPNAIEMRDELRARLAITHTETYCYPFVWENWRKK
jgi:FkbM family methyltransferase